MPKILAAIDPGANAGVAYFVDGYLILAELVTDPDYHVHTAIDRLVIELPLVYLGGRSKVNPNDLIKLAFRTGRITAGIPNSKVEFVRPVSWKGGVPDSVLYKRITSKLNDKEAKALPDIGKSRLHNVLDAIGIGLYSLGRMGPGAT